MNIQTIPRKDKVVKAAFVPKLDAFLFADYSNIELKLLAFYLESVGHPSMADVFRGGTDLHTQTAAGIFGKAYEDVKEEERQLGKRLNFSIVYGGGTRTLIEQLGITFHEAYRLLTTYHRTWPGIGWERSKKEPADPGTLIHGLKATMKERGYLRTLYGRHLHPRLAHAMVNNVCQGSAADLMKWAMVRVDDGLRDFAFDSHVVNMVHDELMFDVVRSEVSELAMLIPEWMNDKRIDDVVPIRPPVEISYTTWADKRPYEEAA